MTKFKYKDEVKIIKGFYREQIGTILSYRYIEKGWFSRSYEKSYIIELKDKEIIIINEEDIGD